METPQVPWPQGERPHVPLSMATMPASGWARPLSPTQALHFHGGHIRGADLRAVSHLLSHLSTPSGQANRACIQGPALPASAVHSAPCRPPASSSSRLGTRQSAQLLSPPATTFNQVTRSEHVPPQCPSAFSSGRFPLTFLQPSLGSLRTWISSHQAPLAQPPDASRQLLQTSSGKAHPSASFPRQSLPTDMHPHVDTLTDVLTYTHTLILTQTQTQTYPQILVHSPVIHSHTATHNPSCTFLHTHPCTCTRTRVHTHSSTEASVVPTSHTDAADTDNGDFSPNENCSGQAGRI